MDAQRGDEFVSMYVNDLTCDYGEEGRQAVRELLARAGHAEDVQFVE
jgi:predicted solute-binding protein